MSKPEALASSATDGWCLNHNTLSTVTVPFGSHLEAEMARLAMDVEAPRHQQAVQKEFRVHGSILAVSVLEWTHTGLAASALRLRASLSWRVGSVMDGRKHSSVRSQEGVWCAGG